MHNLSERPSGRAKGCGSFSRAKLEVTVLGVSPALCSHDRGAGGLNDDPSPDFHRVVGEPFVVAAHWQWMLRLTFSQGSLI
jgi:hypothetical protein